MNESIQVGDVVVRTGGTLDLNVVPLGTTGVVVKTWGEFGSIGVRWDFQKPVWECHDLGGACEEGYGWWISSENIDLLSPPFEQSDMSVASLIGQEVCYSCQT